MTPALDAIRHTAIEEAAIAALKRFPESAQHIGIAQRWIEEGNLDMHDPHATSAVVDGHTVTATSCTCPYTDDDNQGDTLYCSHQFAFFIAKRALEKFQTAMRAPAGENMRVPALPQSPPTDTGEASIDQIPPEFIMEMKFTDKKTGRVTSAKHIMVDGLLWLAARRRGGLTGCSTTFISVTPELALAASSVQFADGTVWSDAADATPENVRENIKPAFARMALTRATARALRYALGVGTCAAEEL